MAVDPKIKILLVEDAAIMRKMEIRILNQLGFENIVQAVDGNDAIEKLQADKDIRIIISDWAMPDKDGYELLLWVRADEKLRDIPFIMATGQGDKKHVGQALEGGANGVVAKPFTPDDLMAHIDKAFGIKRETAQKVEKLPRMTDGVKSV